MPSTSIDPAPAAAIDYFRYPDASGHFGRYGGRFVAETLIGPLDELAAAYDAARVDPAFIAEFEADLAHSRRYDHETWQERPMKEKLAEKFILPFKSQL